MYKNIFQVQNLDYNKIKVEYLTKHNFEIATMGIEDLERFILENYGTNNDWTVFYYRRGHDEYSKEIKRFEKYIYSLYGKIITELREEIRTYFRQKYE